MSIAGRRTVQIALGGMILTALFAYGAFQARDLIKGPEIAITSPQSGATVQASMVRITGEATRVSSIELNDRDIFIDQNGRFREPITLSPGYNVIKVEATDRFGRTTSNTLRLVHQPLSGDSLSQSKPGNDS